LSAGKSKCFVLGQGKEISESKTFKKLDYDSSTIKFTELSSHYNHVLAITENGDLYGWGQNLVR
jgi:alpha-tubulin suppressor-like RCC1 family protein